MRESRLAGGVRNERKTATLLARTTTTGLQLGSNLNSPHSTKLNDLPKRATAYKRNQNKEEQNATKIHKGRNFLQNEKARRYSNRAGKNTWGRTTNALLDTQRQVHQCQTRGNSTQMVQGKIIFNKFHIKG